MENEMSEQSEADFDEVLVDPEGLSPADLYRLGESFYLGLGGPRNIDLAIRWFKQAADRGHEGAEKRLRRLFPESFSWEEFQAGSVVTEVTDDDERDFKTTRGNPEPEELEVFDWFRRQAEAGDPEAQVQYGFFLEEGLFGPKQAEESVRWYEKAAEAGHTTAQYFLGLAHEQGLGVVESLHLAFVWIKRAAEGGHPVAQYYLAERFYNRDNDQHNPEEAMKWYLKAAESGHAAAAYRVGYLLITDGSDQRGEAFPWFLKAAELGNEDAMSWVAYAYWNGEGVKPDKKKWVYWMRQASLHGESNCQSELALMYFIGSPELPKDLVEASRWFIRVAGSWEVMAVHSLRRGIVRNWEHNTKI